MTKRVFVTYNSISVNTSATKLSGADVYSENILVSINGATIVQPIDVKSIYDYAAMDYFLNGSDFVLSKLFSASAAILYNYTTDTVPYFVDGASYVHP